MKTLSYLFILLFRKMAVTNDFKWYTYSVHSCASTCEL